MFEIKRILVPTDFADCSKRALELALQLAELHDAEVNVLFVWSTPAYVSPGMAVSLGNGSIETMESVAQRESETELFKFMEEVKKPAGIKLNAKVLFGVPYEAILARADDYDLVVMGTHGRRGLAHVLLGSVTEKVIRESNTPVLVVR